MYNALNNNLVIVSNRGAYVFQENNGKINTIRTVSGLASAVEPVLLLNSGIWIAWGGRLEENNGVSKGIRLTVPASSSAALPYQVQEVLLTEKEYNLYYHGFANSCLWPLSHQMLDKCLFDQEFWLAYRQVNHKFARIAAQVTKNKDFLWVHDYHLTLLPQLVKRYHCQAKVNFFWHIPFPPLDVYRVLPWGRQLLFGLLGCDFIAFHTQSYVNNFLACVFHYFPDKVYQKQNELFFEKRKIKVQSLPIGVNWPRFEKLAAEPKVRAQAEKIRSSLGAEFVLLGIDRLDYTKGILERIKALEIFLAQNPEYRGRVTLLQVAVPSRDDLGTYRQLKEEVEGTIGKINGFYDQGYQALPIRYLYRSLNEQELVAHYLAADVLLVTALRDGLNLIAKEFVASRLDNRGVLILSSFAGAAEELKEALIINPYHLADLAVQIKKALEMPLAEQIQRLKILRAKIKTHDLRWWWQHNLGAFSSSQVSLPGIRKALPGKVISRTANVKL